MTTGFCARKKADRIKEGEEEVSSSAIEYFNYCIFYNEFNDYDILNLPLVNGKERITFKGLKELIKRLQAESNRKLSVKILKIPKVNIKVSLQVMDYMRVSGTLSAGSIRRKAMYVLILRAIIGRAEK